MVGVFVACAWRKRERKEEEEVLLSYIIGEVKCERRELTMA